MAKKYTNVKCLTVATCSPFCSFNNSREISGIKSIIFRTFDLLYLGFLTRPSSCARPRGAKHLSYYFRDLFWASSDYRATEAFLPCHSGSAYIVWMWNIVWVNETRRYFNLENYYCGPPRNRNPTVIVFLAAVTTSAVRVLGLGGVGGLPGAQRGAALVASCSRNRSDSSWSRRTVVWNPWVFSAIPRFLL